MTISKKMHILFASAEAAPFVKTGGLGDVAGSLPAALNQAGAETIVMVPLYNTIPQKFKDQMEFITSFYVSLGWRNEYCGLLRLVHNGVTYMFIDNQRYFGRDYPYGFFDDGERFAFFSKAICESIQHLPDGFAPDILHCNDWHTALAPVFLREFYQGLPLYENIKTVFSIHNIAFQGQFSAKVLEDICGMAHIPAAAFQLTCGPDAVNYMQGALNYTDAITTVSPTYAGEIQTPAYGENLDGVLHRRRESLQGIVNGIDVDHFNPETDPAIAQNYSVSDRTGKAVCKRALQEELGLTVRTDQPLMTMVTRLTRQKGMDLVTYSLDRILSNGVQVAVLGTGDQEYENALRYFASKYPGQMAACIQFDPALSQRMYAGSDLFLMPSLFEPCGLSQMIAMRYGTLPVVRETGGLKDTVIPYNFVTGEGTGFSFANFNGDEMGDAVFRGARLFWDNRDAWDRLVTQAMEQDFSWKRSAGKYMDLYYWLHPDVPHWEEQPVVEPEPAVEPAHEAVQADKPRKKPATKKTAARKAAATKRSATTKRATKAAAAAEAADTAAANETKTAAKPAAKRTTTRKAVTTKKVAAAAEPAAEPEVKPAVPKTTARKTTVRAKTAAPDTTSAAPAGTTTVEAVDPKVAAAKPAAKKVPAARKTAKRR
ncbi:glycogen synthase GlgA [Collinsella sp. D33t1_170424_A12]|uniref:glycogen synthase GlgA n=1 Tax=Collinsella sp. D33t1_170424_A12 TaxID=2787135 RepID=UPI001E28F285|nr:glycogen synthase GlgA [Collinsella sp. D33t1_170424_A12]